MDKKRWSKKAIQRLNILSSIILQKQAMVAILTLATGNDELGKPAQFNTRGSTAGSAYWDRQGCVKGYGWSQDAEETLQGCFDLTDWDVLCDGHEQDIDGLTGCITDYIHFCMDCVIPTKTVHCFPNNKPWVTKDINASLNRKKAAFRSGNKEEMKKVQRELREKITEGNRRATEESSRGSFNRRTSGRCGVA